MTGPLIVPLDRSEVSEQALPVARTAAQITGRDVVLFSVVDLPFDFHAWLTRSGIDQGRIDRAGRESLAYLDEIAASFSGLSTGQSVQRVVREMGRPGPEILKLAQDYDNPLIVMASHGRRGIQRVVTGSVANQVVRGSSCPVLVIRATETGEQLPDHAPVDRVLVPLDGSPFAEHALEVARSVLIFGPLEIHLLRVLESVDVPELDYFESSHYEDYRQAGLTEAGDYLERIAGTLRDEGVAVTWEVREGPPEPEILAAAGNLPADLIVMATHGRSGIGGLVLGTVAERVLQHSATPVLFVHPKEAPSP